MRGANFLGSSRPGLDMIEPSKGLHGVQLLRKQFEKVQLAEGF